MRALFYDGKLQLRHDFPVPSPGIDEALIRTRLVGICSTGLEILRGYVAGFSGVPGHEFVGEVVRADAMPALVGRRVVGEINCYCGTCPTCRASLIDGDAARGAGSHCPHRTTLGIRGRHGAMADFFTLPVRQLHPVPDSISDEQAVFTEPLAAACEILEQVVVRPHHRVVVLGDGKLGLLIALVLQRTGCHLSVIERHSRKLAILAGKGIDTYTLPHDADTLPGGPVDDPAWPGADIVVGATGSPAGFATARALVRPRGIMVLKSTFHGDISLDLSALVVDEITLVGSRCGPFGPALRLLSEGLVDVESLIQGIFSLDDGPTAFERAVSGALKVLLSTSRR